MCVSKGGNIRERNGGDEGLSHILLNRKISAKPIFVVSQSAGDAAKHCSRLCLRLCVPLQGKALLLI
jgi:hypothetical protein